MGYNYYQNRKKKDRIDSIILILAIALVFGGVVFGGILQYKAGWEHALSYGEKFRASAPSFWLSVPGVILYFVHYWRTKY